MNLIVVKLIEIKRENRFYLNWRDLTRNGTEPGVFSVQEKVVFPLMVASHVKFPTTVQPTDDVKAPKNILNFGIYKSNIDRILNSSVIKENLYRRNIYRVQKI